MILIAEPEAKAGMSGLNATGRRRAAYGGRKAVVPATAGRSGHPGAAIRGKAGTHAPFRSMGQPDGE